jgi:Tfp pilus assembly pilus retraction ATPase PilT
VDTSYDLPGIGRFRVNILHQRGQQYPSCDSD